MDRQRIDLEMQAIEAVELSPEEEARIDEAVLKAINPRENEIALSAEYHVDRDLLLIHLKNGQRLAIARLDLQDLAQARPSDLAAVEIVMLGMAIHWRDLDVDLRVSDLSLGRYGSDRWMKMLDAKRQTSSLSDLHHATQ